MKLIQTIKKHFARAKTPNALRVRRVGQGGFTPDEAGEMWDMLHTVYGELRDIKWIDDTDVAMKIGYLQYRVSELLKQVDGLDEETWEKQYGVQS